MNKQIKPADLIIGAQVHHFVSPPDDSIWTVGRISGHQLNIRCMHAYGVSAYEWISPIPITPERLEQMGFVKWHSGDVYELNRTLVLSLDNCASWNFCFGIEKENTKYLLSSIHHLQALWYNLTGELLKIKS